MNGRVESISDVARMMGKWDVEGMNENGGYMLRKTVHPGKQFLSAQDDPQVQTKWWTYVQKDGSSWETVSSSIG